MKRRVVITGMGTMNPIGNNTEETWKSILEEKCGIGEITAYDASDRKVKLAGEVKNPDFESVISKKDLRKMDRYTRFAMMAAAEAMEDAGLKYEEEDTTRWGVMVASGIGGIATIENEDHKGAEKGYDRVSPYFIPMAISNMAAGQIAIRYHLKGMCSCVVTACASGANAIGDAFRNIRDGYEDLMLCGGSEAAITPLSMGGFTSMKALCTSEDPSRASIPFDKERSGFVMGEGAGILVLEELEHARKRGAKIYGELAGYGVSCDAYHITAPLPDGSGAAACMKEALSDAGIEAEKIDYINAHGTSTLMNDKGETAAVKLAFGQHAYKLKMSSTKAMTGHLLGASAAVEAVITTLALKNGYYPPTIGYRQPDEECDLDIVANKGIKGEMQYAMSNSLGFGGHNASLVFKKFEE
jgi:3-oxoacyl-[acyl-carrier-protein] synthase II